MMKLNVYMFFLPDLEWREMEGDDCEFHYGGRNYRIWQQIGLGKEIRVIGKDRQSEKKTGILVFEQLGEVTTLV